MYHIKMFETCKYSRNPGQSNLIRKKFPGFHVNCFKTISRCTNTISVLVTTFLAMEMLSALFKALRNVVHHEYSNSFEQLFKAAS